ncbi:RNA-directed DNA polymerase from mobile element jockey [Trichonephila clavipes]|nr:RNA-directed DNA polymerase from mobile element jockey [Trichonephila clavipes]
MKEGLIASSYECPKCNEQMGLNERKSVVLDGFEWRCRKIGVNTHVCRSIRKNSWFSNRCYVIFSNIDKNINPALPTVLSNCRYFMPVVKFYGLRENEKTLDIVKQLFQKMGYRIHTHDHMDWDILWSHTYPFYSLAKEMAQLKPNQKVNHFPGSGFITQKSNLAALPIDRIPKSFVLPEEKNTFLEFVEKNPTKFWILKSSNHRGMKLLNGTEDLDSPGSYIQEFIKKPLLINGKKFDVGVYVMLTSIDPLRVYMYSGDILLRFCKENYFPLNINLPESYIVGDDYLPVWEVPDLKFYYSELNYTGKESLNRYLESKGKSTKRIWYQINETIKNVYLETESNLKKSAMSLGSLRNFFELVRFDFIIDEDLNIFLLESKIFIICKYPISPGPDVIFGRMVQRFGNLAKKELLEIFNLSWATGKLPKIWKLSTVIPILKPNKNASECKNYRPISLTSTLCKLMERVIQRRLMNWLIENKKLHFYQTAFRTHHSTTDQLFYLNQSIIDGFQEKPHKKTLAVFLDISAAFDRVWRQKLVHTIQGTGINGKALLWINDFLRGRKFSVRFNGALSESRRMWAGVPQGSVLSPLLFLIFMNTIHHHIHPDTNIACYADDIAVWHSRNDITESEKALNTTLKGIAEWAENLKLTINADKTNYCIFSTDRRHRSSFNANIKIQNSQIKKVDLPTYLGVTLDPELRFSKHIEQTTNKALGKLNILRKLCGTSWGSNPKKHFLHCYQTAVSSTNNEKAEQECGLPPLESRRKLATIKFTNKLRSYGLDHISRRVLINGSILQGSKDLRLSNLIVKSEKNSIWIIPPWSSFRSPSFQKTHQRISVSIGIVAAMFQKRRPCNSQTKGLETIAILSQDNFAIAYTDGSSDRSLSNGGAGIILLLPDEQLHNKRKSCILQWIPAHVNIEGNECADSLAKEARDIEHKCTTITLDDANAVAKHKIMNHTFKKPQVTEFDCPRIITSTIARLRTEHLKDMKIHPDKTRSYVQCKHCPDLQLTPNHILECPTVATKLLKMGMVPLRDSLRELLYSPDAPRIAEAVIKTFDGI